jgi:hypothetical protein
MICGDTLWKYIYSRIRKCYTENCRTLVYKQRLLIYNSTEHIYSIYHIVISSPFNVYPKQRTTLFTPEFRQH